MQSKSDSAHKVYLILIMETVRHTHCSIVCIRRICCIGRALCEHSSHSCFFGYICAGTHRDILIIKAGHVVMQMHCCFEVVTVSVFWRQLRHIICCIAPSEVHSQHMIQLLKRVITSCVMQSLLEPAPQEVCP